MGWVVNFIPSPLYSWERIPVPVELCVGGPQSRYERFENEPEF